MASDGVIGHSIGPYRMRRRLGAGGMGEVYLAYDERLDRQVAMKRIRQDAHADTRAHRRFRREARAAAGLNHPAIVKIHDLIVVEGCEWIVMEWVAGETLARLVTSRSLPADKAFTVAIDMAEALAVAHARGLIHRDLKATNVLVTPDGRAKVTDFGLAKQTHVAADRSGSITIEGQLVGTPHAMSPEQAMGRGLDARSDLFSLGTLLYEIFTGVAPFRSATALETLTKVCTAQPPPAHQIEPQVSADLSGLIGRLLEKAPSDRPANATEVSTALSRIAAYGDRPVSTHDAVGPKPRAPIDWPTGTVVADTRHGPRGERRQVTVVSCELDLGDNSSGALDPLASYPLVAEFEALSKDVLDRSDGHLVSSLGHRWVACYGYPLAHEDDAWRATQAALELMARVGRLGQSSDAMSTPPRARATLHTGPAVVLDGLRHPGPASIQREEIILGKTLDMALEIQRAASSGQVLVSDTTQKLIAKTFRLEPLDADRDSVLLDESTALFRVLEPFDASSRWHPEGRPSPLVGRHDELGILLDRWRSAERGHGQVVLVKGEAGIGKSRLVAAFEEEVAGLATVIRAQGLQTLSNSPFHPIVDLLRHRFRLRPDEAHHHLEPLSRLEQELAAHGPTDETTLQLFALLLGIEGRAEWQPIPPDRRRPATLEALRSLITTWAEPSPLAFVLEDLHWMDPSTLELLHLLIARCSSHRIILLMTFRPELDITWEPSPHVLELNLSQLPRADAEALILRVSGGRHLPAAICREILARTDGVPLFIEELTKTVLESDGLTERVDRYERTTSTPSLSIPTTLRSSLTARLDRLGASKHVAQLAALIGREFSFDLLVAVTQLPADELRRHLDRLVATEMIQRRGFSRRNRFAFRHALIQETSEASLVVSARAHHHRRIAETLESRFPEVTRLQPERLAHHFEQAGDLRPAVGYLERAGHHAADASASVEAVQYFERGLTLLEALPESDDRSHSELDLQLALCKPLVAVEGYTSEAFERIVPRAEQLCSETGRLQALIPFLYRFAGFQIVRGDAEAAPRMVEKLAHFAAQGTDPVAQAAADCDLGALRFWQGQLEASIAAYSRAVPQYSPETHYTLTWQYGDQPPFTALLNRSWSLVLNGQVRQAWRDLEAALSHLETLDDPFNLARTHCFAAGVAYDLGHLDAAREAAEHGKLLAEQYGFTHYLSVVQLIYGGVEAQSGSIDKGLEQARRGLEEIRQVGASVMDSISLIRLATALLACGRREEGLATVDEALEISKTNLSRVFDPEALRLKGELLLLDGTSDTASEGCFRDALALARRQQAGLLALRAAMSLDRLSTRRGSDADRQLLAEVYDDLATRLGPAELEASLPLSPDFREASGRLGHSRPSLDSAASNSRPTRSASQST